MSDQFLAEIRLFPYTFAPRGWAFCQGQLMQISQNTALFSLLGTQYGGNGTSTFALPDLRGTIPIHWGNGAGLTPSVVGETGGEAAVTLLPNLMPPHTHPMGAIALSATAITPAAGQFPAEGHGQGRGAFKIRTFAPSGTLTQLVPESVGPAGSGAAHNNLQLSLIMNWCIAVQGIFPARN